MTTFAPTFTSRWKGKYIAAGIQHTLTLRAPRGLSFILMDEYRHVAEDLFNAFVLNLSDDFAWISAEVCPNDTDVFIPATTPTPVAPGTVDWSALSTRERIRGLTFSGKASLGRARFTLFGIVFDDTGAGAIGGDGLISAGDNAGVSTAVSRANEDLFTAGNLPATFKSIATYKENDHLLKLVRRGTIA